MPENRAFLSAQDAWGMTFCDSRIASIAGGVLVSACGSGCYKNILPAEFR
jgi:hypothetical protein